MVLGLIISFTSFVISFYTCKLIIDAAEHDPDFSDTLQKYYGPVAYYIGLFAPGMLIVGAVSVYFVIMTQVSYPIFLAIASWCSGTDYVEDMTPSPKKFSPFYTAIVLFFVCFMITSMKDLKIFMKIGSFGSFIIMAIMAFIVVVGIYSLTNTSYTTEWFGTPNNDWTTDDRTIALFSINFAPIAGVLCAGYFIHTCALPIIRSAAEPEKNIRNVFLGYFLVFISYAVVGSMGYIGFIGIKFEHYFVNSPPQANEIDQNCLNMFEY
mmetsp:Transcript_64409/g.89109  ORF Transcript_64409/g.89109 Transcript_64409/m.89109 type:complete len:266 (+) Transcript_64409:530-1327(+)